VGLLSLLLPIVAWLGRLPTVRLAAGVLLFYLIPDCPDICTNYLGFETWPDAHGLARPGVTRTPLVAELWHRRPSRTLARIVAADPGQAQRDQGVCGFGWTSPSTTIVSTRSS
jgi:hypothetical protein